MRRAEIAQLRFAVFKPELDTRFRHADIVSHDQRHFPCQPVRDAHSILDYTEGIQVVGIDEAQFFDMDLLQVCNSLAVQGIRVIAAGLDMDFQGRPFGPVPGLMAIAEHITKVHAVCVCCGAPASYSYRKVPQTQQILLGEQEHYEPRCRTCFYA